jgi:hypothetical protein
MSLLGTRRTPADTLSIQRQALEAVLASAVFAPSSNCARLLSFVCEKYFEDPGRELTEYEIAVGALGRRSDFDPRTDSIVRVETHRLRKRLTEFYKENGASLPVRILLPLGQYSPQFQMMSLDVGTQADGSIVTEPDVVNPEFRPQGARRFAGRIWYIWPAFLVLLLAGAMWFGLHRSAGSRSAAPAGAITHATGQSAVRILAGSNLRRYLDASGHLWEGDRYFEGGATAEVRYGRLTRTPDIPLYQHVRQGYDFSYHIPLTPGIYELRMYFAESSAQVPIVREVGEAQRVFTVTANGKPLLPPVDARHLRWFDIYSDAGGADIADVKVFHDVSPASDGKLHLRFLSAKQQAVISAIEILPGLPGRIHPTRMRAGEQPYTDDQGSTWLPDVYAQGGRLSLFNRPIAGTTSPALYQGERFGHFTYTIPVASGSYTVSLGFTENYHTIWNQGPGAKVRLFNVYINGIQRLKDFDVYTVAGGALKAITRTFRDIDSSPQDKISISFEPVTDYAIVNVVEVIPQ